MWQSFDQSVGHHPGDPCHSAVFDHHIRMKRIDLVIKSDHELRLTRRWNWDVPNFLKHIVGSQFKGSRYKGLYVFLPLMDFNEKLVDFNLF